VQAEARPFRALAEWAARNGQSPQEGDLLLSHVGRPVWQQIDAFFFSCTKLAEDRIKPLGRTAYYCDSGFYEMRLFQMYGGRGPTTVVNPLACLSETMPAPLLHDLAQNEPTFRDYLDHFGHCIDSFQSYELVIRMIKTTAGRGFLTSSQRHLNSCVADLLDTPPNPLAAGNARFAFESALKGLLAEVTDLTTAEARSKFSHNLDTLIDATIGQCADVLDAKDLALFIAVAKDSKLKSELRQLFPDVRARYEDTALIDRRVWQCYAAAQHALATVLRTLGGNDSRKVN
jgi:hypothetical protein